MRLYDAVYLTSTIPFSSGHSTISTSSYGVNAPSLGVISQASILAEHCGYAIGDGEPAALDSASYQETLELSPEDVEELKVELEESLDSIVGVLGAM